MLGQNVCPVRQAGERKRGERHRDGNDTTAAEAIGGDAAENEADTPRRSPTETGSLRSRAPSTPIRRFINGAI